jgi:hypothetical protein
MFHIVIRYILNVFVKTVEISRYADIVPSVSVHNVLESFSHPLGFHSGDKQLPMQSNVGAEWVEVSGEYAESPPGRHKYEGVFVVGRRPAGCSDFPTL